MKQTRPPSAAARAGCHKVYLSVNHSNIFTLYTRASNTLHTQCSRTHHVTHFIHHIYSSNPYSISNVSACISKLLRFCEYPAVLHSCEQQCILACTFPNLNIEYSAPLRTYLFNTHALGQEGIRVFINLKTAHFNNFYDHLCT